MPVLTFHRSSSPATGRRCRAGIAAALLGLAFSSTSHAQSAPADERAGLEQLRATTLALIQALVDQGLLSRERAEALVRQATQAPAGVAASSTPSGANNTATASLPAARAASQAGVVRVPYIPETLRAQIKEEIKNDVFETAREERWADSRQIPTWIRGMTIEGDVRVRAEAASYGSGNVPADVYRSQTDSPAFAPDLTNTETARRRLTLRARLGVNAKLSEDTSAGFRLATSNPNSPATESVTLGSYGNRLPVGIDRAFVRYEPRFDVRVEAGRTAVPFLGTDLLWPDDLSVDGASARVERNLSNGLVGFAVLGGFALEELALQRADKWLYGLQVGADWAATDKTQIRGAMGFYDFQNIEGRHANDPPPTGARAATTAYQLSQYPTSARQKGNTLINLNDPTSTGAPVWGLASKFKPFNATAGITFSHFAPTYIGFTADYVKNTAFDLADIRNRAGTAAVNDLANKTSGIQLRTQVGSIKLAQRGDWQSFFAIRKFERDAWLDAFTDTTWHLGGTNYKGFQLGGSYAFDRSSWLTLRYTSTRNLDDGKRFLAIPGDPTSVSGNLSSAPLKIDVLQLEVNSRF